jgi:hypothetical protein
MDAVYNRFAYLLEGYKSLSLTKKELAEFYLLVNDPACSSQLEDQFDADLLQDELTETLSVEESVKLYDLVWQSVQPATPVRQISFLHKWRWAAAAVILLAAGLGTWLLWNSTTAPAFVENQHQRDIQPGKEGAILTLGNGAQIVLDDQGNGMIAEQRGANILLQDGQLQYQSNQKMEQQAMYNTMSTPKGRTFTLQLPDGTKVWLNAASSIRYPTIFTGKDRSVEINGEAYFEVAKDPSKPFRVDVNKRADIEVLGTSFNVHAYDNESSLKTTLIEGSVRVENDASSVILKPGQQARVDDQITIEQNASISKVMAWKNGQFNFEGMTLKEVMRQLERWYDIEVVYEKNVKDIEFFGKLDRNLTLEGLMKSLKYADINFRIEGRKLIIMP